MILGHRVEFITVPETMALRHRVLRPADPIEACYFANDHDGSTFHLGLFLGEKIVSIASFVYQSHPQLSAGCPFRLRGMATDEKYRGRNFGGELLRHGIESLRQRRCDLLWFNARERAFGFYQKSGFQFQGSLFHLEGTGPHKVMYKHLIPR